MRFNFLKQKYVSRKIINAINVLQFFIYKNGANQPFAFDLWWLLLNINHSAWCSKSARLLVRDRLGSNCVRKKSARVLLGSKVARNFSARSAILIEDDRIEMLEQLKFLLVNNPSPYCFSHFTPSLTIQKLTSLFGNTFIDRCKGLIFVNFYFVLRHF